MNILDIIIQEDNKKRDSNFFPGQKISFSPKINKTEQTLDQILETAKTIPSNLTKKAKKQLKEELRIELLRYFQGDFYQEKQVLGKWLVKYYDRDKDNWNVMVFKSDSTFRNYKNFRKIV